MIEAVTASLSTVIGWVGTVINAMTTEAGELAPLLPLLAIGIGISALFLAVKVFKSFTWGT